MTQRKAATPEVEAPAPGQDAPTEDQQPPNGVLVLREFDANGQALVGLQVLGDVRSTEIATILKLAEVELGKAGLGV